MLVTIPLLASAIAVTNNEPKSKQVLMRKESLDAKRRGELLGRMEEVNHVGDDDDDAGGSGGSDDDDGGSGATDLANDGSDDNSTDNSTNATVGWECPADDLVDNTTGQEVPIADTTGFVEYFNLSFKVKIHDFDTKQYQVIMTSDEDAFTIEATGPKYCEKDANDVKDCTINPDTNYKDRIMAYVNTDAQELVWKCHSCHDEAGEANQNPCAACGTRGILGQREDGYLFSQKITPGEWHDVILTKNKTHLILTVDGQEAVAESKVQYHGPHAFDTLPNSTKVLAGTETGDISLDGQICNVELNTTVPDEHKWDVSMWVNHSAVAEGHSDGGAGDGTSAAPSDSGTTAAPADGGTTAAPADGES